MKKDMTEQTYSILRSVEPETVSAELICRRVSSHHYITSDNTVETVAGIFDINPGIHALGVVDQSGKALGLIIKAELLALIGQRYGRELYLKKSVSEIIKSVNLIYYKRNTFSVIDEINDDFKSTDNIFYILVDSENNFKGYFSSFDLVLFLSDMMRRELNAARMVHSAIMKDEIDLNTENLSVSGSTLFAGETGGDFEYIREIGDNRLFISLCDVSGKGLNAGLIAVAVSSMYAVYNFNEGISELIKKINSFIYDLFNGGVFLTGVFIDIDELTGIARVYDMGHSMVYLIKGRKINRIESSSNNFPLGIDRFIEPSFYEVRLESGDLLLSYSDGFPEQNSIANERFGELRLISLVIKYYNFSLKQIKNILYEELKTWRFGHAQGDDMSLLMLKYK